MKPAHVLILSLFAGTATFGAQHYLFPARLHAAPFAVPKGPDWRQQMIDRYPGGTKIDHVLARLSDRLDLNPDQISRVRPILQKHHDALLALLVAGPPTMTREQFQERERQLSTSTREQIAAVLTPAQRELVGESFRRGS
jgi:hypothetical protein